MGIFRLVLAASDDVGQRRDDGGADDAEAVAKVVPEGDAKLAARLGEAEECVAAVTSRAGLSTAAHRALCHLAADVGLRAVGVQRDLRPVEHHQQFGLVSVQPFERNRCGEATYAMRARVGIMPSSAE